MSLHLIFHVVSHQPVNRGVGERERDKSGVWEEEREINWECGRKRERCMDRGRHARAMVPPLFFYLPRLTKNNPPTPQNTHVPFIHA